MHAAECRGLYTPCQMCVDTYILDIEQSPAILVQYKFTLLSLTFYNPQKIRTDSFYFTFVHATLFLFQRDKYSK